MSIQTFAYLLAEQGFASGVIHEHVTTMKLGSMCNEQGAMVVAALCDCFLYPG